MRPLFLSIKCVGYTGLHAYGHQTGVSYTTGTTFFNQHCLRCRRHDWLLAVQEEEEFERAAIPYVGPPQATASLGKTQRFIIFYLDYIFRLICLPIVPVIPNIFSSLAPIC